jgi:hypothetical protein
MGSDSLDNLIFVPAGRSFFTSVGKAVAAFEHGRILDPLTLRFGRLYAQFRENRSLYIERTHSSTRKFMAALNDIFGGELLEERGTEYVVTADGRKIPLSALSSGQQELLPLITVLPFLGFGRHEKQRALIFIEEPEAHLFPRAQSQLVEALAALASASHSALRMVLTTHSPYVLSKFNNLIRAGQLARRFRDKDQYKAKKAALDKLIAPSSQIAEHRLQAYAIVDGTLKKIVGKDGMIDAEYLDEVSGDISHEFSELLKLEFAE